MLWYVGKKNKIKKGADILGTHMESALTFDDSKVYVRNNSLSISIASGLMETTCACPKAKISTTTENCSNIITVFKASITNIEAKCRVQLSSPEGTETAGIKIGMEEVKPPG